MPTYPKNHVASQFYGLYIKYLSFILNKSLKIQYLPQHGCLGNWFWHPGDNLPPVVLLAHSTTLSTALKPLSDIGAG